MSDFYSIYLDQQDDKQYSLFYDLHQFLGNHELEITYSGSGDSGSIDDIFLDVKPVSSLNFGKYLVASDRIGDELLDLISCNTWIFISFDNGGSRGRITVKAEEDSLIVTCHHIFQNDPESEHITKKDTPVKIDHRCVVQLREIQDGQIPIVETYGELCCIFYLLGISTVCFDKELDDTNPYLRLKTKDGEPTEALETLVANLIEQYLTYGTDIFSLTKHNNSQNIHRGIDLRDIKCILSYQRLEDGYYSFELEKETYLPDDDPSEIILKVSFDPNQQVNEPQPQPQ